MKLIRYWTPQTGDKPSSERWRTVQDTPKALEQIRKQGAAFISTMAFEYEPDEGKDEPRRSGPLVFDFDNKENPEIARQDSIKVVRYLEFCGVHPDQIHYSISGDKGLHMVVAPHILGATEGDPLLPLIYQQMVEYLIARIWRGEPCTIDNSMYAMGKGKLLRMNNMRRESGTYKVPVTWDELSSMPYSELIKLAKAPRHIETAPCDYKIADLLATQFRFHQIMVHNPPASGLMDVSKIIMKCGFIKHCIENVATLSEPEWHAMISVIKGLGLGQKGRWLAHDWSRGYLGYTATETDKKYETTRPNMGCDKIKERYDCAQECGVRTPSELWSTVSSTEASQVAKSTEAQKLLQLAENFDLYPAENGEPYADVIVNGHRETYPVRSKAFRGLLYSLYFQKNDHPLKIHAANDLVHDLAARALHGKAEKRKIYTRVAHLDGAVFIDLCDDYWRAIEVTAEGWRIVDEPPVRFRRVKGMRPLPVPVKGGSIKELRNLLNVEDSEAILFEAWLLGAYSNGPYPVLILEGEQGTAKSTTTQILRQLIDPSNAPTRAAFRTERDLAIAASNSHVIALDNLSGLRAWQSDALCRIATGGSFSTRKLHTDDEEMLFCIKKPIVLNGIVQIATRHDLADRSLRVTLPVIDSKNRLTEEELSIAYEKAAPKILAGICDGVACALKNRRNAKVENPPRMADFTQWCVAAEDAMPWSPGEFLKAYQHNQNDSIGQALEADLVANAILQLMEGRTRWEGNNTALLKELDDLVDEKVSRSKAWPTTSSVLGRRLTRIQAFLRKSGLGVERQRNGARLISITNEEAEPVENPNVNISEGQFFM